MNELTLTYGWLPAMLAVGSLVGSVFVSWRARSVIHSCLSVVIFAGAFCTLGGAVMEVVLRKVRA